MKASTSTSAASYNIRLRAYGIPITKSESEVKEFIEKTVRELTIGKIKILRLKPYKKNNYIQFHKVDFGIDFDTSTARGKSQRDYLSKGKKIVRTLDEKHVIIHAYTPKHKRQPPELHTIVPDSDTYDSDLEILYNQNPYFVGLRDGLLHELHTNSEMSRASTPTSEVDPWYAMVEAMTKEELIAYMATQRSYYIGPITINKRKQSSKLAPHPPAENTKSTPEESLEKES